MEIFDYTVIICNRNDLSEETHSGYCAGTDYTNACSTLVEHFCDEDHILSSISMTAKGLVVDYFGEAGGDTNEI